MSLGTLKWALIGLAVLSFLPACTGSGQGSSIYDTSNAEIVGESLAGAANAGDGTSTVVGLNRRLHLKTPWSAQLKSLASNFLAPPAFAGTCATSQSIVGQTCVSGNNGTNEVDMTLNCTGVGGTWSGTYVIDFDSGGTCSTVVGSPNGFSMMGTGASVTFNALSANGGIVLTTASGAKLITTTDDKSGYLTQVKGGISIGCNSGGCGSGRSITINGVHRVVKDSGGTTILDHTISTLSSFSVTGTGGSKSIAGGTLLIQHNLLKYTMSSRVTKTLTFASACCYPVGGEMLTTFSGSKSGTETIDFGPVCGAGTVGGTVVKFSSCQ